MYVGQLVGDHGSYRAYLSGAEGDDDDHEDMQTIICKQSNKNNNSDDIKVFTVWKRQCPSNSL